LDKVFSEEKEKKKQIENNNNNEPIKERSNRY
jgi:hypothetical protein